MKQQSLISRIAKEVSLVASVSLVILVGMNMIANESTSAVTPEQRQAQEARQRAENVRRRGPDPTASCRKTFLGLVPWYYYMKGEFVSSSAPNESKKCDVKCFNVFEQSVANDCGQKKSDVPGVLLAVVDNLLRIAGIVAVAFVLVGAFQYMTSQGDPEGTAKAQSTIINALIGLAAAMVAVAFVSFVGSRLV